MSLITPEEVLTYTAPTNGFLCPLSANTYNIEFYRFTIRDMETNNVIFDVERPTEDYAEYYAKLPFITREQAEDLRTIRYEFPASFLRLKTVGAKLIFGVNSEKPVPSFRMIERHYFRNVLIKSFDFTFGFCIPHSTNSWEAIYDMPKLNSEWEQAIIDNPFETASDSFYFVENQLVMQNKAYYSFCDDEGNANCNKIGSNNNNIHDHNGHNSITCSNDDNDEL